MNPPLRLALALSLLLPHSGLAQTSRGKPLACPNLVPAVVPLNARMGGMRLTTLQVIGPAQGLSVSLDRTAVSAAAAATDTGREAPSTGPSGPGTGNLERSLGTADPAQTSAENIQAAEAAQDLARTAPTSNPSDETSLQEFARRAEQLFHGGRLAPDQNGAVVIGPRRSRPEGVPPTDEEMRSRMAISPLTNAERERAVAELFRQAGAKPPEIVLQQAGRPGRHNLYVVKKGRTDRVVVIGGHHDKVSIGAGTIDNWSGATMVVNLYQAMRDLDTEATFVFIAFAREEEGLLGSRFYLKSLPEEQRRKIDAMVNLDTLAVNGTFSLKNGSTRELLDLVQKTAEKEKIPLEETTLWGGDSDHSSFRRYGIAALMLFGASQDVIFDIIHSENDTMAHFNLTHYKNAYLLALAFVKTLAQKAVRGPVITSGPLDWQAEGELAAEAAKLASKLDEFVTREDYEGLRRVESLVASAIASINNSILLKQLVRARERIRDILQADDRVKGYERVIEARSLSAADRYEEAARKYEEAAALYRSASSDGDREAEFLLRLAAAERSRAG